MPELRITKREIILKERPKADKAGGLGIMIPKFETKIVTGEFRANLYKGQRHYKLPDGAIGKDVSFAWIV